MRRLVLLVVVAAATPRHGPKCRPRRDGSNYFVLSGGNAPLRLARLAEEFEKIGANYTLHENARPSAALARRFPYFSYANSRTTSSGGSESPIGLGHLAMIARAARRGAADCSCLFEDDVIFHPDFRALFYRYFRLRRANASAWQLGSFTRDLGDYHRSQVPYFQAKGWVPGFEVGAHAYCARLPRPHRRASLGRKPSRPPAGLPARRGKDRRPRRSGARPRDGAALGHRRVAPGPRGAPLPTPRRPAAAGRRLRQHDGHRLPGAPLRRRRAEVLWRLIS